MPTLVKILQVQVPPLVNHLEQGWQGGWHIWVMLDRLSKWEG